MLPVQRPHERRVPLASHQQCGGKQVRFFQHQDDRTHAPHGLACGVDALRVDGVFRLELLQQGDGGIQVVAVVPVVIYRNERIFRGYHDALMTG